jgi:hypothetical protein
LGNSAHGPFDPLRTIKPGVKWLVDEHLFFLIFGSLWCYNCFCEVTKAKFFHKVIQLNKRYEIYIFSCFSHANLELGDRGFVRMGAKFLKFLCSDSKTQKGYKSETKA